jgi:hypothetical protein
MKIIFKNIQNLASVLLSLRISPLFLVLIATIVLFYAAVLSFNAVYIQSIGCGFSGLFHMPLISQSTETYFYLVGVLTLMLWSLSNGLQVKKYPLMVLFTLLVVLMVPAFSPFDSFFEFDLPRKFLISQRLLEKFSGVITFFFSSYSPGQR